MERFTLPGGSVYPEGITEGPGTSFFVGSLGDGTIFRGDLAEAGDVPVWLGPNDDERTAIAGLDVDGHGRLLACAIDTGELYAYDLSSTALVARQRFPAEGSQPNDVVVSGDAAYVTDTRLSLVWRVPAGADGVGAPEMLADLSGPAYPEGLYLNGIVASPDGSLLLVASQGTGQLWRIPTDGSKVEQVELDGYDFNADGMLLSGDVLYGVTNRGDSWEDVTFAVPAFRLAVDWRSGELLGELAEPAWNSPTTLALVDGKLLVVCSQLKARHFGTAPELPFEIVALDLPEW
ncbi:SMP-30/gluconolactonase/LRE family protein [Flindersiella endophytica]